MSRRRAAAQSGNVSGRRPGPPVPGSSVFQEACRASRFAGLPGLVGLCARRKLAGIRKDPTARSTAEKIIRSRMSPVRTPRLMQPGPARRCRTKSEWEFAGPRRPRRRDLCVGGDFAPGGRLMANTWQGRFPGKTMPRTDTKAPRPSTHFLPTAMGSRHDRQRMGVDREGLRSVQRRKRQEIVLRAERARRPHPTPRGEGRLAPLRA